MWAGGKGALLLVEGRNVRKWLGTNRSDDAAIRCGDICGSTFVLRTEGTTDRRGLYIIHLPGAYAHAVTFR
jgi:hypothetical protein